MYVIEKISNVVTRELCYKLTNALQVHLPLKCSNVQMFKWSNVEMCKCSNVQTFKCSNVQMFKCSNVQMFKCSNVQMFKCSNVQMFKCSYVQMFKCSNVQMFKCSRTFLTPDLNTWENAKKLLKRAFWKCPQVSEMIEWFRMTDMIHAYWFSEKSYLILVGELSQFRPIMTLSIDDTQHRWHSA